MRAGTYGVTERLMAGLVVLGLAVTLAGCDDGATGSDTSNLSLQLTDQPSPDLQRAWVEITEIELQGTAGSTVLMDQSTDLIELTQLVDRTEELVSDVAVSSGEYSQLRIVIGAAAVEAGDKLYSHGGAAGELGMGKDGDLQCPSCTETGIKVNLPDGSLTLETESKIILLDFDVAQSYGRQAGASGMWVLNPLIRTSEIGVTGTVAGTVGAADGVTFPTCGGDGTGVEDFVPELQDPASGDVVASGDVAPDGSYAIQFLNPAEYDTGYSSQVSFENGDVMDFDATASTGTAVVEEGTTTTVDYTVEGATCTSG